MGRAPLTQHALSLSNAALGLVGESGEVADKVKKHLYHGHELDKESLKKELGDVLWYVSALCSLCEFDLGDVMALNVEKLKHRYPRGFSRLDSQQRVDLMNSSNGTK